MCVQRDVVKDKFMLTCSQAVKWPSSKRADCKATIFTTSLLSKDSFLLSKGLSREFLSARFAGKHNQCTSVNVHTVTGNSRLRLKKLELMLTGLMCRAFFSRCGNLAQCWEHLSAPTQLFQKSRLRDVLMITFALQTCTTQSKPSTDQQL